jgi:predicted DNA-binding ArsR family transcriptional regulator
MNKVSDDEQSFMEGVNTDGWASDTRKATVFVPLSESFYSNAFASDTFGDNFTRSFKINDWIGMLKEANWKPYDPQQQAAAEKRRRELAELEKKSEQNKKEGGKLITDEEALDLLFG